MKKIVEPTANKAGSFSRRKGYPEKIDTHLTLDQFTYALLLHVGLPLHKRTSEGERVFVRAVTPWLSYDKKQERLLKEFDNWAKKKYHHFRSIGIQDGSYAEKEFGKLLPRK